MGPYWRCQLRRQKADDLGAGVRHKRKITAADMPDAEGVSTRGWEDQLGEVIAV